MFENIKNLRDLDIIAESEKMDFEEQDPSAYPVVYRTYRHENTTNCIVVKFKVGILGRVEYLGEYKETI